MKKIQALVYTSNAGHNAQYAKLLGEQMGLRVFSLEEAKTALPKSTPVMYLGWLMANQVKNYKKAAKLFDICGVCGVGLCDTGTAIPQIRKANSLPEGMPVFTLQGGLERKYLAGPYRFAIDMLTKGMASKKDRTGEEERMLQLLCTDENLVDENNLSEVLAWYAAC